MRYTFYGTIHSKVVLSKIKCIPLQVSWPLDEIKWCLHELAGRFSRSKLSFPLK